MQVPLELAFHELEPSEFVETHIRDRVESLERFHNKITSCRVTVEAPHRNEQRVTQFRVRVVTRVPGSDLVAESKPTEDTEPRQDVYYAIDEAFDAAEKQLRRLSEKLRANRNHRPRLQAGVVASIDTERGSGLIEALDGRELSFTNDDVRNAELESLSEGETVEFMAEESNSPYPSVEYVRA